MHSEDDFFLVGRGQVDALLGAPGEEAVEGDAHLFLREVGTAAQHLDLALQYLVVALADEEVAVAKQLEVLPLDIIHALSQLQGHTAQADVEVGILREGARAFLGELYDRAVLKKRSKLSLGLRSLEVVREVVAHSRQNGRSSSEAVGAAAMSSVLGVLG